MKKLLLTVLLFIWLSPIILSASNYIFQVTGTGITQNDALIRAQNEFRKRLLEYL